MPLRSLISPGAGLFVVGSIPIPGFGMLDSDQDLAFPRWQQFLPRLPEHAAKLLNLASQKRAGALRPDDCQPEGKQ
jgi:hypothetical protein